MCLPFPDVVDEMCLLFGVVGDEMSYIVLENHLTSLLVSRLRS